MCADYFHCAENRILFCSEISDPHPPPNFVLRRQTRPRTSCSLFIMLDQLKEAPVISGRNTKITLVSPQLLQRQVLTPEATPPPTAATKILRTNNPLLSDLSGISLPCVSSLAEGHSTPYQTTTLGPCARFRRLALSVF